MVMIMMIGMRLAVITMTSSAADRDAVDCPGAAWKARFRPKFDYTFRTTVRLQSVRKKYTNIGQESLVSDLGSRINATIDTSPPGRVWVPADFAALGSRDAIDKALQRMVAAGALRRIDRGLYDRPAINRLTKRPTVPDYREILDALSRRDGIRVLVDGMTAANDLGLTDAVPARVTIHTDSRRRTIHLEKLTIAFKLTAPSRLYWAGRPAMRVVQALHWLKDTLPRDGDVIRSRLTAILADNKAGPAVADDLRQGFSVLPAWMQDFIRTVPGFDALPPPVPKRTRAKPRTAEGQAQ